jgi:hypothetical protein
MTCIFSLFTYHYLLQKLNWLAVIGAHGRNNPSYCTEKERNAPKGSTVHPEQPSTVRDNKRAKRRGKTNMKGK